MDQHSEGIDSLEGTDVIYTFIYLVDTLTETDLHVQVRHAFYFMSFCVPSKFVELCPQS